MVLQKHRLNFALLISLWVLLAACQSESNETSVAQRAKDEIKKTYDELVDDKMDAPIEWATNDIENFGDWEYRVESLAFSSPDNFAAQLNVFGDDRWEVIWLEKTPTGYLAFLKKPSISYLSKLPLSQIGKIVIGGSDGNE